MMAFTSGLLTVLLDCPTARSTTCGFFFFLFFSFQETPPDTGRIKTQDIVHRATGLIALAE